ncbi:MAG: hypothetical protein KAJ19_16855, partial [Gammaproteobacteria bacterium]|nr:hypothetical protein [Gammaproteobacteria bacterium]
MARNKPYVRAMNKNQRGYLDDRKLRLNTEAPTHVHSEGLKPYLAKKAGANFMAMEELHPSAFGVYPDGKPLPGNQAPPDPGGGCTGHA